MEDKINKKLENLWQIMLGELELRVSRANFITWFKETSVGGIKDKHLLIFVPNNFTRDWLTNKFEKEILKTFRQNLPNELILGVKYKNQLKNPVPFSFDNAYSNSSSSVNQRQISLLTNTFNIQPKYRFDNFIVGNSNRLAHATSLAAAKTPGALYNPLFVYGGVGLGKTHLIQAIGNEIARNYPDKKVVYVPCEKFTSEFVQSISSGKINEFKNRYRNCDVLLVDDIQFLSHKEGIQEEFFHTFNALHQSSRQIILTSDRVPHAIPAIADRLSSRFGAGMVADIKPPDLEMRNAIIQAKCREKNYLFDSDALELIAQYGSSNIRELEGLLIQIATQCQVDNLEGTVENVKKILKDIPARGDGKKNISGKSILKIVADFFDIDQNEILGQKRTKNLVYPRQLSMYLMRHEINYSFPNIGKELGGKDHSTVMHGCKKIEKESSRNSEIQEHLARIKERLYDL